MTNIHCQKARSFVPQDDNDTLLFWATFAKNLNRWFRRQDPSFLRMTNSHCHSEPLLRRILTQGAKGKILRSSGWQIFTVILSRHLSFWAYFAKNLMVKMRDPSFLRMTNIDCQKARSFVPQDDKHTLSKGKILRSSGRQTHTVILSCFCEESYGIDNENSSFP